MNQKQENEIDILRAHAVAGALRKARPTNYLVNDDARTAWYNAVTHCAAVVCTKGGVSLTTFYDLCGVPD